MWRSYLARVLVWFVALAGLGLHAAAQTNTGNVYGNVIDESGGVLPGGTATLTGDRAPVTTSVDSNGLFRFLKVPPGKYSVTVNMPGFTTVTRENVIVNVGGNTQVDVQLRLSAVQEAVTVTSATPLIDTRKVETGQNFSRDELQEIPTARDVWGLIQQVPGIQIDSVQGAGANSATVGGPDFINKGSGNVVYQVDGSTITDNTYGNPFQRQNGGTNTFLDFATFEDVEVATGGSVLEQQTSGVTINVVTKRGTNEYRGNARFLYASDNWQSDNTPDELAAQGFTANDIRFIREYGADFGGPIVKDKVWLWFAGAYQTVSVNPSDFYTEGADFPETANLEPWSAKLNWQITNANAAQLYYSRSDRQQFGAGAAPGRPIETRIDYPIITNFYKIEDSHVFSSDFFASIFGNYQAPSYSEIPIGSLDCGPVRFQIPCEGDGSKDIQYFDDGYHNNYTYYWAKDPQKQGNLQMSKFFNTGNINHEVKFSFNYRQQIADSATGLPGNQNNGFEYADPSSNTALISRGVRPVFENQIWSGTLGDTITAGNFTAQLGVRYDRQQARNLPGQTFENPLFSEPCPTCLGPDGEPFPGLPAVFYHGSDEWQFDFTNWQPRVSASYALGEKKNTLLRASYAQFADQLGFIGYYGSGVPISNGAYYYWNDMNTDHTVQQNEILWEYGIYAFYNSVDPFVLPNVPNIIDPNLKTPKTQELTFGADHQLTDNFAVSATFSYRTTNSLFEDQPNGSNINTWELAGRTQCLLDPNDENSPRVPCVATAANGFTLPFDVPFYSLTLEDEPAGVTISNRPGATQRYYGIDLSIVKRLSDKWMLRGNFGWNNFTQHLNAESIRNPNNFWSTGGSNCGSPPETSCPAVGFSSRDQVFLNGEWQFNVTGLYQAPWGINFGVNFFGRQGYPNPYYVRTRATDAAGISHIYSILIDQVDTFRYENVYQLDFRLEKAFTIGGFTITPAAEIFNVTNNNAVLERYQRTGDYRASTGEFTQNAFFNDIVEVQSPRILRLGIAVAF